MKKTKTTRKFKEKTIKKYENIHPKKIDKKELEKDILTETTALSKWESFKYRFTKSTTFFIVMRLRNGSRTQFTINTTNPYFDYDGGTYIIDEECKFLMSSSNMYALEYHQDISLPIRIHVDVKNIVSASKNVPAAVEVEKFMNPFSLRQYVVSKFIQDAVKGAGKLTEEINMIKLIIIVNLILSVLIMIVMLKSTKMLDNIHIPGFT